MRVLPTLEQLRCMINICGTTRVADVQNIFNTIEIPYLSKAGKEPHKTTQLCQYYCMSYAENLSNKGITSIIALTEFCHTYLLIPTKDTTGRVAITLFDPTIGQFVSGQANNIFIGSYEDYRMIFNRAFKRTAKNREYCEDVKIIHGFYHELSEQERSDAIQCVHEQLPAGCLTPHFLSHPEDGMGFPSSNKAIERHIDRCIGKAGKLEVGMNYGIKVDNAPVIRELKKYLEPNFIDNLGLTGTLQRVSR